MVGENPFASQTSPRTHTSFRLNTPNQGVFNGERIRTFEPHLLRAEALATKKATKLRLLVLYKSFFNFRAIKKQPWIGCLNGRGERIRTFDLMFPKHARYQAAPHPVAADYYNILYKKSFVKSFLKFFKDFFLFGPFSFKKSMIIIPYIFPFVKWFF